MLVRDDEMSRVLSGLRTNSAALDVLAGLHDAAYVRTHREAAYERNDLSTTLYRSMADGIVREINPSSVLDVGCAIGLLVEALRDRNVDAFGVDSSTHAIKRVQQDVRSYCWVGSILDPPSRQYDLLTCYDVVDHLPPADGVRAIENLSQMSSDILFSSSTDDDAEDIHYNFRPIQYWATLFAKHGFFRDVDFDPLAISHPSAVRFRKTKQPLHRIVGDFERGFSRLLQENIALRVRARQTKTLLVEQARAVEVISTSKGDITVLEQTVAEQTVHLDALNDRLTIMSDRERDLRTMLHDAHEQLLQRDETMAPLYRELEARYALIAQLDATVRERTAWAERMVGEAEARGQVIDELQQRLTWAEGVAAEVEARGHVIEELQRALQAFQEFAAHAEMQAPISPPLRSSTPSAPYGRAPSEEALALARRLDTTPVRMLVRGLASIRRTLR